MDSSSPSLLPTRSLGMPSSPGPLPLKWEAESASRLLLLLLSLSFLSFFSPLLLPPPKSLRIDRFF